MTFTFEGEPMTLEVSVDGSLYEGASRAQKTVTRFGNARENDWIEDYFPAFVEEEHQMPFYDAVIRELRRIKAERGLDSDRYAELITVFAQSIEYRTDPVDLEPKFPVETFVDCQGDCDDKTLLLAALLAHEDYDVAVLLFEAEKHVALGIRSDDLDYRDTGYAYTETTAPGYIGMVPKEFAGGVELHSMPRVFAIGDGRRRYNAGDEVRMILNERERAVEVASALYNEIAIQDANLRLLHDDVQERRAALDALPSAGDRERYDSAVVAYTDSVERYNAAADQRNALVARYNRLAEIDRVVAEGLDDRLGTFYAVRGMPG
jgi:hypothetical protein